MTSFLDNFSELVGRYPFDDAFIEKVRQRVIRECSKVPVHIHKRTQAQNRLELAAREAIVMHFDETYADAWFPFTLRQGWPTAHCIITGNKAVCEISFGPETDGERGGQEIEPVEFNVIRVKPNIISRVARRFMSRDQKAEREVELAPIGKPDDRHELVLRTPAPKPAPNTPPAKATPTRASRKSRITGA